MDNKKPETITSVLRAMEVGDMVVYPLEKFNTVKSLASNLGMIERKVYSTSVDRTGRIITVMRTC